MGTMLKDFKGGDRYNTANTTFGSRIFFALYFFS